MKAVFKASYKGFDDEPLKKVIKDFLNKKDPNILKKARITSPASGFDLQKGVRDIEFNVNLPKKTMLKSTSMKKGIYSINLTVE